VKTQEQVWTQHSIPAVVWRSLISQDGPWAEMRVHAAEYAAADGKTLTDTPETREVLYERFVTGANGEAKLVECAEAEAEFVRLRLACWATAEARPQPGQEG
jgi:hypothetical protein